MKFSIRPYFGTNDLEFGMKREVIREKLGNEFREFKKSPFSKNTTDAFKYCHVYYDSENLCVAVEFFEPSEINFNDLIIIGSPYDKIRDEFARIDESIDYNDAGFTSFKYGIGIFAPFAKKKPKDPVESVIIFKEGYYGK